MSILTLRLPRLGLASCNAMVTSIYLPFLWHCWVGKDVRVKDNRIIESFSTLSNLCYCVGRFSHLLASFSCPQKI